MTDQTENKLEQLAAALKKLDIETQDETQGEPKYSGPVLDWISGIGTDFAIKYLLKQLASQETREQLHGFVQWIADKTNASIDAVIDQIIARYVL
ncbi:MAG: hypothetical protein LBQ54_02205 [Planctomycetaceae bacterium]|jgi:hypothetical protein|nr:hypothetical protein [Planctomycetaceae bacterium]